MIKRVIRLSVILAFMGAFLVTVYAMMHNRHDTIEFEDAALEKVIRDVIDYPEGPITRQQLESISVLDIPNAGIETLTGIEGLTSLRILNLESNAIQDVSPLANLRHLEVLNLRNNAITDLEAIQLSALANLGALRELNLRHNVYRPDPDDSHYQYRITDVSVLAEFTQLERLILRDNDIEDVTPLAGLTNLFYLDLSENPLTDHTLSSLSGLFRLEHVNLRETNITDIAVLASFPSLKYVNLHSNIDVHSLAPIAGLTNLQTLILRNVPVGEDITYLANLTNLRRLNLRNTGIDDLAVLASLMEAGALQDRPAFGEYADVDIRDNPIPIVAGDTEGGYNPLRDFWHHVTYRHPYLLPIDPTREVVINEFMASNGDTISDFDGDYEDWIELHNPTDSAVDISGYFLSDDRDNPSRWRFPDGTVIPPGGHLLVWASGKDTVTPHGEIHTNFRISQSGEPLILTAPDRITLVDKVIPIAVPRNMSYGRYPDGSDVWEFFDRDEITPGESNHDHDILEFEDEALEQALRDYLELPQGPLTSPRLRTITELNLTNAGIETLTGIEALTSLRVLTLDSNAITDVTPLATLARLETLSLRDNAITDLGSLQIGALAGLPSLRELSLRNNHIDDITPLAVLTTLRDLDLRDNRIDDTSLSSLSAMHHLDHLNLRGNQVTTLTPLATLSSLTYLNLHSNVDIISIAPLANLTNLQTLILRNVPVGEDIVYLATLTSLLRLNLRNTGIDDVSVLASLMEAGVLQDRPALGVFAEVDIRDNPIPILASDADGGYAPLLDFWPHVLDRYPYTLPVDPTQEIVINEFMASNGETITDVDGDYEDWIELYNPTASAVDISGYYLSDDSENPLQWRFPEGTVIPSGGFLLVWASGKDIVALNGEIHTSFSISRSGEPLIITAPDGHTLVDQLPPISMLRNVSYGRYPDGSDTWEFFDREEITPGSSNNDAEPYDIPDWLDPRTHAYQHKHLSAIIHYSMHSRP